jgi:hypothetical protein
MKTGTCKYNQAPAYVCLDAQRLHRRSAQLPTVQENRLSPDLTHTLRGAISTFPLTLDGKTKLDSAITARSPRTQDDSRLESALTRWYALYMVCRGARDLVRRSRTKTVTFHICPFYDGSRQRRVMHVPWPAHGNRCALFFLTHPTNIL